MKRLPSAPAPRVRFVCTVLTLALLMPHFSLVADAAGSRGLPKTTGSAAQTTGAPESNLPSLDEIRQLSPAAPQAPPPVPSTRCSPSNPNCVPGGGASFRMPGSDSDGVPMLTDQLAWNLDHSEFASLLETSVRSVSDYGFALLGEARPSSALARAASSAGSFSPAVAPSMVSGVFSDDFNDNSRDAAKWSTGAPATGNVVEQNRRLEITPPASATGYNGYFAASTHDLTGGRAAVEVVRSADPLYGIETHFQLTDNATGNYLLFVTSGGNFAFQSVTNGVMSRVVIPHDAARHRFWRFRHETAADQLVWETSQDGLVWVAQRRIARPFPLTSLQVLLLAGKYTASTPTSTAIFDNLRLEPNPARRVFFADDFDDNARDAAKWNFYGPGTPVTVVEQNRRLEITPSPTTTGYNGFQSVAPYDMTDAGIVAEVTQATAGNAETRVALMRDGANILYTSVSAGSILFDGYTAGVRSSIHIPYDPAQHRFWRIRHEPANDTIIWETSADGVVWVARRTSLRPFPVTSMTAQLIAGKWTNTGASAPGMALFDNFRLERNAPAYSPSDDFNDNALDAARWTVIDPASPVTTREQNQRIEFALQPNTASYNWIASAQTFDLTSRTLQTEFVQATHQGGSTEAFLKAVLDGGNFFHIGASTGYLIVDVVIAGARDRVLLTYNPTSDRFLRLRHNLAAHTMNFETSADSKTWATRRVVPVLFSLSTMRVELGAGAWATYNSTPGTAVFDNLRLEQNDPNSPPTVGLTAPVNGAMATAPANITLTADASDSDGQVAKVEFYQGTTKLGEDTVAPYSFTWNNVAAGSYGLTARAMDGDGAVSVSAAVSVTVDVDNGSPTVSITGPATNASFTAGDAVTITANASDADGSVTKVEFYQGTTKLGEDAAAPYSFTWNNVAAGSYSLTAKATDNVGAVTTSNPVNISVVPPTLTVTASDAVASEPGTDTGSFIFSRTGSTAAALTVNFAAGGTATGGADYNSLGSSLIIPAGASTATLTVTAVDDAAVEGGETVVLTLAGSAAYTLGSPSSATVTINDNDTLPPTAQITSPAGGAVFNAPANITINATAADPDAGGAVVKVEFFSNGVKLGEDTTAPYSFAWNNVAANNYSLTARATDIAGATGTSAPVNIVVNAPPTVTLTAPAAGSVHTAPASITLTANASDSDGSVAKVEFYQGTTKLGEDTTAPYSFVWSSVPAGGYTLKAVAADNRNVATTSALVGITVNNPPTVSLSSPANGSIWNSPANIPITANASDPGGSITKVEFYQGATRLVEDTVAPYTFSWNGMAAGSYTLTARATDNLGATTTSAAVSITVNGSPTVSITGPAGGSNFAAGSIVTISAAASDPGGSVSKVEFYNGATKLGEDTTAPYSYAWGGVPAGSHALTARAIDNNGAQTTSAAVTVHALDFTAARLDPGNRTGADDLFSRNFNWGVSLVSLPGRAGLDLSLALSYNSLVWTKSQTGSAVLFDGDRGFPTPGFRFGFPVIQGPYARTLGAWSGSVYVLVTPSGARVELRQIASNLYEAADSSNLRLEVSGATLVLRPADGSRLTYSYVAGEYQCVEVKDADGNYLTATYTNFGRLASVTDTLGRVVSVQYDAHQNPIKVTQLRTVGGQSQEHVWATFGYENRTVSTAFGGLAVVGAETGRLVPVLTQVGLDDGTRYNFNYNDWGQVTRITRSAQDALGQWVQLAYTEYTLTAGGADCPRFTERRDWARDWNKVGGVEQPVMTSFSTEGDMQVVTLPDGTQEKVRYVAEGFKRGLPTATETWGTEDGVHALRKWTTAEWTQDNESLGYAHNPRVWEMTVNDGTNTRRTKIDYLTAAESPFRLPKKVSEYQGASTLLRYTETAYEPASTEANGVYTGLRIIGLVSESRLFDAGGVLQSKVSYQYDTAGCVENPGEPVRHDPGYGVSARRGLVCSVLRHNVGVVNADNPASVEVKTVYNTAGAVLHTLDPLNHKSSVRYDDRFSDGVSRNTFAYPTAATDPDQNAPEVPEAERKRSSVTYNFDTGAVTTMKDVKGAERVMLYDAAGRVVRATRRDGVNQSDKGYTRLVYSPTHDYVQTFTQLDPGVESYSVQVFDGAGRVRASARLHPGSAGGYSGRHIVFDTMGRAFKQSNPTEMSTEWEAAGDDAAGWVYATQTYDWKGRPRVSTDTGGFTREATYAGCGCAGGEVVTLTDAGTQVGDGGQAQHKRRRQKIRHDILGRVVEAETFNWNDQLYSTTTTEYNGRDQVTAVKFYQGQETPDGSCPALTCQQTTMTYDEHGRLKTRQTPEQTNPVSYLYNPDDTPREVTDARRVVSAYTYNNRHQVKTVNYAVPGDVTQPVSPTAQVSFAYDEAGNRTSMSDGTGGVTYTYDVLSRLAWEERTFAGLSGNYRLTYGYSLADALKSITDHEGASVSYGYDAAGQLQSVSGTPYANVSTYASNFQYRAWGAPESFTRGDGRTHSMGYDARLQLSSFEIAGPSPQGPPVLMKAAYNYHPDGQVRFMDDQVDDHFDRGYEYDYVGRLSRGLSGVGARTFAGLPAGDGALGPYRQVYTHDVWGNLKAQAGDHWSQTQSFSAVYTNNRRQGWLYDDSGRVVADNSTQYGRRMTYDAAGHYTQETEQQRRGGGQISLIETDLRLTQGYDGDGRRARREEHRTTSFNNGPPTVSVAMTYYVRSSVLGGKTITELGDQGQKVKGYVYAGGAVVVKQWAGFLYWRNTDPVTGSMRETSTDGLTYASGEGGELDPQGRDMGRSDPYQQDELMDYSGGYEWAGNGFDRGGFGCQWGDGLPAPCSVVEFARNIGVLDGWENPVKIKGWDPNPNFMGYDYWAGADLQYSSELRRNPEWVERDGPREGGPDDGFFIHESGPQSPNNCVSSVVGAAPQSLRTAAQTAVPELLEASQAFGLNRAQTAYVLASAQHESGLGQSMTEIWGPTATQKNYENNSRLGNTQPGDGYLFRGRGYVQITGRNHYATFSAIFTVASVIQGGPVVDFTVNPDLVLNPKASALIAVGGMASGMFTTLKLGDFTDSQGNVDFFKARAVVNGDRNQYPRGGKVRIGDMVAGYARNYLTALNNCNY